MKLRKCWWIGFGGVLLAAPAFAQDAPPPSGMMDGMETIGPRNTGELRFHRSEISAGLGVMAYFSGNAPGTSAAWDVRYGFNASRLLTIEAAYTGAAGDNAIRGASVATLLTGDLVVKPLRGERFNPFVLAGAGWGGYSSTENGPSDHGTVAVPLGAGAEYRITDRLTADARWTYNLTLADSYGVTRANLDNWTFIARAGAQF